jgi:scyllo-inositol 2-dehydrogenase (NADP+)
MIRVGLLGFGMGGRVLHAPLISSVEGLELAAVLERTSNKAAERYPGITVYRSLPEMLADTSLSLFVVSTPSGTHYALAKEILSASRDVGRGSSSGLIRGLVIDKPMTVTSAQAAELIALARKHNVLLAPFHNRRWDSDFLTVQKLIHEGSLGRLVSFESTLDRWRLSTRVPWKDDPAQGGGNLLDHATHLADQALVLFGLPQGVSAEVRRERDGEGADDAFTLRLRYPGVAVTVAANSLATLPRPRFLLRGTSGNYLKSGVDPQEAALNKITRIADPNWGQEPSANWGILNIGIDGGSISRPVPAIPGDYRLYYAGIRDALLGKSAPPVSGIDAWHVARLLEWAQQSSDERREIACDWSEEPELP